MIHKKKNWFIVLFIFAVSVAFRPVQAGGFNPLDDEPVLADQDTDVVLEPWTYTEDFENKALGAWASYPHWQDLAYDQNFRFNEMIPGDPNLSIVQKVTPYSDVDNYAGAQKLLDMFLVPNSTISFRYYLKTSDKAEFFKIRFAAGNLGKLDYTLNNPQTNKWVTVSVSFNDFVKQNPIINGMDKVRIYALAFFSKIPKADPAMPIYFGLDDITFKGAREMAFRFSEPFVYKLPEFEEYIPQKPYFVNDEFHLKGDWPLAAKNVRLRVVSFTDNSKSFFENNLNKIGENSWELKPVKLSFPIGLYLGYLSAYNNTGQVISTTKFTIHIAPSNLTGVHPRLMFDEKKKEWMEQRLKQDTFKVVDQEILDNAKRQRERVPLDKIVYDIDQYPDEDWLPTWSAWAEHIYPTGEAVRWNSRAYAFFGDKEAGNYTKQVLLKLTSWPTWTHPWQLNRGRFADHRSGAWSHRLAEAYDLIYDLLTPDERARIRNSLVNNIIKGVHRTYVVNNNITGNTSNWIAMTVGGSLINMAAMYEDGAEVANLEPYFTGAVIKLSTFLNKVVDKEGGAWGESLGYNAYSFQNLSFSLPALKNVFGIDLSKPLIGSYNEYIWAGYIKGKEQVYNQQLTNDKSFKSNVEEGSRFFYYGDNGRSVLPAFTEWAFLLDMQKEPRLSWLYNYLKQKESYADLLFDTRNVPAKAPFNENPNKLFPEVGTVVFKSGWEKDDFVFVMRSGAFYNHQHMDQGSFWIADKGVTFTEERKGSTYYDDPIYQSWFIQPVAHSTILIDHNKQGQRIGDGFNFAPGFEDNASMQNFLDGKNAAFVTGDIGKLYWGKVKTIKRNVLYLKPRTILMLDVVEPADKNVDVSLLFQPEYLNEIKTIDKSKTQITKNGETLNIIHAYPDAIDIKAVETPHYLFTLQRTRPLTKEGMLNLTYKTQNKPLVMANIMTTNPANNIALTKREGFVTGKSGGETFAFNTNPGAKYKIDNIVTDALAIVINNNNIFLAQTSSFEVINGLSFESKSPITLEIDNGAIKFNSNLSNQLYINRNKKPKSVVLNGKSLKNFSFDKNQGRITIDIEKGEGTLKIVD